MSALNRLMPDLNNLKKYIGKHSTAFGTLLSGTPLDRQPLLIPQYTTLEIGALDVTDFFDGYLVFNTTTHKLMYFDDNAEAFYNFKTDTPVTISAIDATATATAAQIAGGVISSTSAAAVSITLPTVAQLVFELISRGKDVSAGARFQFVVNNAAGANTVTLVLTGTGISVNTPAITGGAALTVSTANAVAIFEIVFLSGTTAKILRIA